MGTPRQSLPLLKNFQKTVSSKLNLKLGQAGENRAAQFLAQKDYQILAQNWRWHHKEIDLIAWDENKDELVFVEVKTRRVEQYGHPSQAVNQKKLKYLITAAQAYLRKHGLAKPFRFDIISILPEKIEHFENVTWYMMETH